MISSVNWRQEGGKKVLTFTTLKILTTLSFIYINDSFLPSYF